MVVEDGVLEERPDEEVVGAHQTQDGEQRIEGVRFLVVDVHVRERVVQPRRHLDYRQHLLRQHPVERRVVLQQHLMVHHVLPLLQLQVDLIPLVDKGYHHAVKRQTYDPKDDLDVVP